MQPTVTDQDTTHAPPKRPTGREAFPGFVARSRRDPSTELHHPQEWERRWIEARAALAASPSDGPYHRWQANAEPCA